MALLLALLGGLLTSLSPCVIPLIARTWPGSRPNRWTKDCLLACG
jgi:hypothetical protein